MFTRWKRWASSTRASAGDEVQIRNPKPETRNVFGGVRLACSPKRSGEGGSPGAASRKRGATFDFIGAFLHLHAAAPGDGRTPAERTQCLLMRMTKLPRFGLRISGFGFRR